VLTTIGGQQETAESMTHRLVSLALIAAVSSGGVPPQSPLEPASGHLLIDAVAVDRNGMPIPDLRPEELEVWINGYRVPIETLTVMTPANDAGSGRSIVLLLDDVTLDPAIVPRARDAARRFVNGMWPGDQMSIVTLNGTSMESTGDRARLLRTLDAYTTRATGVMRLDTLGELVLGKIAALSRQLTEETDRRKTIVAIGSAWLFDTPIPPPTIGRDLRPEWTDAMRAMAFARVTLYVIDPGGVGMSRTFGGSSGFARETGGYTFTNTNDFDGAAERIMREAGSYYVIRVADPPVGRKANLRELDVRVLRRGVTVRARRAIPGTR
jgi:VWFA-related protein